MIWASTFRPATDKPFLIDYAMEENELVTCFFVCPGTQYLYTHWQSFYFKFRPKYAVFVEHTKCTSKKQLDDMLKYVLDRGGEGLMIRQPKSKYERTRSHTLLKIKKFYDAEVSEACSLKANNMNIHAYMYKCACTHTYTHIHSFIQGHTNMYTHTPTCIHMHTHMHTPTHSHTLTSTQLTHSPTCSLTRSPTQPLTRSLTHSLTHSLPSACSPHIVADTYVIWI